MKPDEVYQAAMQAGSGGIRYNDSTKTIQLMDTEKNWVNWKHFNATASFRMVASSSTNSINYTLENNGLYIFAYCRYQGSFNVNSTAAQQELLNAQSSNGSTSGWWGHIILFNGFTDDTINITYSSGSATIPVVPLYYLGNKFSKGTLINYIQGELSNKTISTNLSNHVVIGVCRGQYRNISIQCTTNDYATNSDCYACGSTIDEDGDISITATGASNYGSILIADIQLSD